MLSDKRIATLRETLAAIRADMGEAGNKTDDPWLACYLRDVGDLVAEREAMRAVVEAADAYYAAINRDHGLQVSLRWERLREAVEAYRAAEGSSAADAGRE